MSQFNLISIVSAAIALLLGFTVHEFAHAWMANRLGDPTARLQGRVTLNPLAHMDPLGAIMFVLMLLRIAPIAWGKPVPINPYYIRGGRRGVALATAAGPLSNVLFALIVAIILRIVITLAPEAALTALVLNEGLTTLINDLIYFNVALAAFNLIPLPPLDGFGILEGLAPPSWDRFLFPLRQYGMWILLFLVLGSGLLGGLNPLGFLMGPLYTAIQKLVWAVAGLP